MAATATTPFLCGGGDDAFTWNPGDDNDIFEGQAGSDRLLFNGANVAEIFNVSANGSRVLFTRNIASVVMDLDDVENPRPQFRWAAPTLSRSTTWPEQT